MDNLQEKLDLPYFKEHPRDEISDSRIQLLTLEEFGAYQRLKFQVWIDGGYLPFDGDILRKILKIPPKKFQKIWEKISPLFFIVDEKVTILELQKQREKYGEVIEQKRFAGQKSAERRANIRSTPVEHPLNGRSTIPDTETDSDTEPDIKQHDVARVSQFSVSEWIEYGEQHESIDDPIRFANSKRTLSGEFDADMIAWIEAKRPFVSRNRKANGKASAANVGKADEQPPLPEETKNLLAKIAETVSPLVIEQKPDSEIKRAIKSQLKNDLSQTERDDLYDVIQTELRAGGFDDKDRDASLLRVLQAI